MGSKVIIISISLFLTFACGQTSKNNQEQKEENSIQVEAANTMHEQDTVFENEDFYYGDDATKNNEEWEEDTLSGYIEPKKIDTANFAFNLKPSGNYKKIKSNIKAERLRL
ncbi:MAG: hypothetical protein ABFS35_14735, partial [Bacteroidota bacterium]